MENTKTIIIDIDQIEDKKLELVTGGDNATRKINGHVFSGHVTKYKGVVGANYYITFDCRDEWYYGTLLKTWEKQNETIGIPLPGTVRTHRFLILINNGFDCSEFSSEREFSGDYVTLYRYMD